MNIARLSVLDLLWKPAAREEGEAILYRLFHSEEQEEQQKWLNLLPRNIQVTGKEIHIEYKQISAEGPDETSIMVILTDITEKLSNQAKIEYLSYHDSLTSLYNRTYIEKLSSRLIDPEWLPVSFGLRFRMR